MTAGFTRRQQNTRANPTNTILVGSTQPNWESKDFRISDQAALSSARIMETVAFPKRRFSWERYLECKQPKTVKLSTAAMNKRAEISRFLIWRFCCTSLVKHRRVVRATV